MIFVILFLIYIIKNYYFNILLFITFMIFFIDLFIKIYLEINPYSFKNYFDNFDYVRYAIINF
mgnify:CR=1 FL=1